MVDFVPIPKFSDELRPPIGGWHGYYDINDRSTRFLRHSANAVIDELERHRRNNNKFTSREDIEREVWQLWCSYQPQRCGISPADATGVMLPKDLDKAHFGPIIWRALNHISVMFDYVGRDFWQLYVQHIPDMMTCPLCRDHWAQVIVEHSPIDVRDKKQACVWTNTVHNIVNVKNGKSEYPYAQMVREYGAPL